MWVQCRLGHPVGEPQKGSGEQDSHKGLPSSSFRASCQALPTSLAGWEEPSEPGTCPPVALASEDRLSRFVGSLALRGKGTGSGNKEKGQTSFLILAVPLGQL